MLDVESLGRRFGDHASAVEAALKSTGESVNGFGARLTEIEQKLARRGSGGGEYHEKSWGQTVADSEQFKALQAARGGKARVSIETKAITTGSTSGGPLGPSERIIAPNTLPQRQLRF